ncbi:pilus assembly PilX family protein [Salinibius halmophilus]|uniref:pilus assembly PilX family protein n=1 Tax=Salinibius halmophilus TaxID=1853216 RepID=UPI000E667024|nr:hypothetical protein [Salinibius halmophilus]
MMKTTQLSQSRQQGSVLIVALVFLVLLTIAGVSAMRLVQVDTQSVGASIERTYAQQAGEAALIRAEEIVHQRMANFDSVLFFAEGEDTMDPTDYLSRYGMSYADRTALCTGSTVCFYEGQCVGGFCSVGYFDTKARQRITAADTGVRPYHMFPLGLKPSEIGGSETVPTDSPRVALYTRDSSGSPVATTDKSAWQARKLSDLTAQKPWEPGGWYGGNAWSNSMAIDVNVTTTSTSGLVTTETYQANALVEFLGFNLAEGADVADALKPENMPPSQYWMMTYRATVKVAPQEARDGTATTAFDGARTMVQGVYTRQIPQSIDAIMSINGEFARVDGTAVTIDYGENCLENEMLNGSDYCHFKSDIPPLVADGVSNTGWAPSFDNVGGCFKATCANGNWSVQDNPDKPAMDTDQYFARYFKGASKTAVYDAAVNDGAVFSPAEFLSGADMTGKKVVVIDGDVDLGSTAFTASDWNIDPDARLWINGRLHTDVTPGASLVMPKVGLFYVSGSSGGDNYMSGSTVFRSVIAFENGFTAKNSIKVTPYNNIFEGDVAGALANRSRYSWRELDFTN